MAKYYEAEALIEFVKNYSPNINGETTLECVERAIRNALPADAVPRSEIEQLQRNLEQCENGYKQQIHLMECKHKDEIEQIFALIWDAFQSTYYDSEFEEKFNKIEKKYIGE